MAMALLSCWGMLLRTREKRTTTSPGRSDHCLRRPHGNAVAPLALRGIQSLVGGSQNIAHRGTVVREKSHTHRDADSSKELAGILHAELLNLLKQDFSSFHSAG